MSLFNRSVIANYFNFFEWFPNMATQVLVEHNNNNNQQQQQQKQDQQHHHHHTIRTMDATTICNIISRAKYQMKLLNEGYSRGDSHRRHIRKRFEKISTLNWASGERIDCDKCGSKINFGMILFIHKRRSYNRYFHKECAVILNLL